MGKLSVPVGYPESPSRRKRRDWTIVGLAICGLAFLTTLHSPKLGWLHGLHPDSPSRQTSPYGTFPIPGDPFHFLPCTKNTVPPSLNDNFPEQTWAARFDPNPDHWSWTPPKKPDNNSSSSSSHGHDDPYADRGIYLCGYLDVPLDYTNSSDRRIVRLAITKLQVSGLARLDDPPTTSKGKKSSRTIIINPGGPGGSGTGYAWRAAARISARLSDGAFDVLGWDPRGVNVSLPAVECFPYDASRDHWALLKSQHRAVTGNPRGQLELSDAMNAGVMQACWERQGDLARFLGTGMVARDLEQIRNALGEEELTGYLVSYGTGIGQTYAAMFPDNVGRLILDGTEYVRDHRMRGGFGWTALDNATDAWRDGFLGECLKAGPEHCVLAKGKGERPVTLQELESRMEKLMTSLAARPVPAYLPSRGATLVTYSALVNNIYGAMYNPKSWPTLAQALYDLEAGNSTLAATLLERSFWYYDPTTPCSLEPVRPSDAELGTLVICADSYDAKEPDDFDWWSSLWMNMTTKNWIAGNSRFYNVLPCRHFLPYWPQPVGVYRGDLNHTLRHPVMLIAETYDPATPLRNGRRLLKEMGRNARLIVHHGYGHASAADPSSCTDKLAKAYIMTGEVPEEQETECWADGKPYRYEEGKIGVKAVGTIEERMKEWREHLEELRALDPLLMHAL